MQITHRTAITLSGILWLSVGLMLLTIGLGLFNGILQGLHVNLPLMSFFSLFTAEPDYPLLFLIVAALILGHFKGRFVLKKSAQRAVSRIQTLNNPTPVTQVYSKAYFFLILGMMFLGFSIRWLGVPADIRGFIDVTVGAALINGSLIYFRYLW